MTPLLSAALGSFALCLGLRWVHLRIHRLFPEDPASRGARHQHQGRVPMAGWVLGLIATLILALSELPSSFAPAVGLCTLAGWLDDRGKARGGGLDWRTKGLLLALALSFPAAQLTQDWSRGLLLFGLLFALTNAVNFMDNSNGVCAALGGCGLLLASGPHGAMAWIAGLFLGFLPLNWPRARLFLGDAGALGLGACLGLSCLVQQTPAVTRPFDLQLWLPALVFALDFVQVVTARLILGVPPWQGDRRHLTHILMNLGLPQALLAPTCVAAALLLYALLSS